MVALRTTASIRSASNPLTLTDPRVKDLSALKRLALHYMRLDRNWMRPVPRILGEVRKRKLGDRSVFEANHLFQFPDSELFLFHSGKHLKCFNFGNGEYTTVSDMDAYVRCASYDFLPDKSVLLGIALRGGSRFDM